MVHPATRRWGDLEDHISDDVTREEFVASGYVMQHRGRAHDRDSPHVTNRRTPSPGATAEDPPSTPDVDADEVTLGTHGDKPLEVRSGVVAAAGHYIIIDGMSDGRYEAARIFQEWYGSNGAEQQMRAGSIARSFPWVPGEDMPMHRAQRMEGELRRQSESRKPPTHAPRGNAREI